MGTLDASWQDCVDLLVEYGWEREYVTNIALMYAVDDNYTDFERLILKHYEIVELKDKINTAQNITRKTQAQMNALCDEPKDKCIYKGDGYCKIHIECPGYDKCSEYDPATNYL